jgi:hypothetical protein
MSTYKPPLSPWEPTGLEGLPIGLQEYYALYPGAEEDLLLLAMPIARVRSLPFFPFLSREMIFRRKERRIDI